MSNLNGIKGGKKNVNREELILLVSNACKVSRKDTKLVLDTLYKSIPEITKGGGYITIAGLGTFKEKKTKARIMNLSKKQRIMLKTTDKSKKIPAKKYISFSSSKMY